MPTFTNKKLFNSAITYFNPNNESVVITPKEYKTNQLTIQSWQSQIILLVLVVILPLAFLAAGLFVWLRRKNM
jgi:uncharacterized sodium:solute symporter family permease YidK